MTLYNTKVLATAGTVVALTLLVIGYLEYQSRKLKRSRCLHDSVGNTPLIFLKNISHIIGCDVYGKAEFLNPGGSIKDRFAQRIAHKAFALGYKGLVEATSGSTGISLTMAALSLGLKVKLFVPDDQAQEKISILRSLGASVTLTRPATISDPHHMCNEAQKYSQDNPDFYYTDQFDSAENFKIHYESTAEEIIDQAPGIKYFIASAGTGGTIAGVSARLKEYTHGGVCCLLADVQGSALATKVNDGVLFHELDREGHRVRHPMDTITEGIGLSRLTTNFNRGIDFIDAAITVTDGEAVRMAYYLLHIEGLFCGSSSAVNCAAVVKAWKLGLIKPGSVVVTILCDSGMRHLSKFWSHDFLRQKGLLPNFVNPVTGTVEDLGLVTSSIDFLR